ncbi:MAG TPA: GDSL-type esterase/lipase family protein [Pseudonocardiaceae bacterium]
MVAAPTAAAQDTRPTAVVSLGDSAISGEGAGNYEPGTRGENGNWCHRSANALIHRTALAQHTFNLACSGADAANVSLADTSHYTEGSQARRLIDLARQYRVTTVVVQVGANDEPAFADTVLTCVGAWINFLGRSCSSTLSGQWPGRVAAMAQRVIVAVNDVKSAMNQAGYANGTYNLVVTSYASPFTENMRTMHGPDGCPIRISDARWGRTSAVPQLSEALRGVANATGAKFLDFSRATEGKEACSNRTSSSSGEWQNRIKVDPFAWWYGGLDAIGIHTAQESFHPNAAGHAQLGRCVTEFVTSGAGTARCLIGSDGNLHAVA